MLRDRPLAFGSPDGRGVARRPFDIRSRPRQCRREHFLFGSR